MECDQALDRLARLVATEGAVLDEALEQHLAACGSCAEALADGLEAAPDAALPPPPEAADLRPVLDPAVRPSFAVRLLARLSRLPGSGSGWILLLLLFDVFAAFYYLDAAGWDRWHGVTEVTRDPDALACELTEAALVDGFTHLGANEAVRRLLIMSHEGMRDRKCALAFHVDPASIWKCLATHVAASRPITLDVRTLNESVDVLEEGFREGLTLASGMGQATVWVSLGHLLSALYGRLEWQDRREKATFVLDGLERAGPLSPVLLQVTRHRLKALLERENPGACSENIAGILDGMKAGWTHHSKFVWPFRSEGLCYWHGDWDFEDGDRLEVAAILASFRLQHVVLEQAPAGVPAALLDPRSSIGNLVLLGLVLGFVAHALALGHLAWLIMVTLIFRRNLQGAIEADPAGGARSLGGLAALGGAAAGLAGIFGGLFWWGMLWVMHAGRAGFTLEIPGENPLRLDRIVDRFWSAVFLGGSWHPAGDDMLRVIFLTAVGGLVANVLVSLRSRVEGARPRYGWIFFPIAAAVLLVPGLWMEVSGHMAAVTIFALALALRCFLPRASLDGNERRRLGHVMAACLMAEILQLAAGPGRLGLPFSRLWADGALLMFLILVPPWTGFLLAHLPAGQRVLQWRLAGGALGAAALAVGPRLFLEALEGGLPPLPLAGPTATGPGACLDVGYFVLAGGVAALMVMLGLVLGFRLAPEGASAYAGPPSDEGWPRLVGWVLSGNLMVVLLLLAWGALGLLTFHHAFVGALPGIDA